MQKLPVDGFEYIERTYFTENFIINCDKNSNLGYILYLYVGIIHSEQLGILQNELSFIQKKMKINKQEKLIGNLMI